MEYIYIPNGTKIESGKELPAALYKAVEKPKKTTRKRTTKKAE